MRQHLIEPGDVCLLLSASIRPNALADVSIADPVQRETDYLDTLAYYLNAHPGFKRFVFIDNSGWPLDKFAQLAASVAPDVQIELISLDLNDFAPHLGKSYGEMLLLERGIERSTLAKESVYLAKLTGRLPLTNLTALVQSVTRHFDLLCDVKDHPINEWLRRPVTGRRADTRFFMFRLRFWDKYVRGHLDEFDERRGEFVEWFFYRLATRRGTGEVMLNRLPREPVFEGLAGHGSKDYSSSAEKKKRMIRDIVRRAVPWLKV
ncbi:hypothetical protein [Variovorax sp. PAMC 28711]|uniref:hypothetical protein n=1 Tax=Variovorax sp. PAMC 28711 TaxID=1795631 RepID=UPI00078C485F|nr:hypothetical protein [Variovorax sp. PAMC 28711]AMM25146.1 hypothetical protein AX767_12830 [Variovorax sp. PAMC 28711]